MTLRELFDQALTDSGQFLFGVDKIEMNEDNFLRLVKNCLDIYNDYEPIDRRFNLQTASRFYTFSGNDWEIPTWIAEIIPVVISGLPWYFQNWMTWQGKGFGDEFNPLSCIWRYNRPTLYVEYVGTFTVWAVYERPLPKVGSVNSVSIISPGSFYNVNDVMALIGGNGGATVKVTGIGANGGVTNVIVENRGDGYWLDTRYLTTVVPSGGQGCELVVTGLGPGAYYDLPNITYKDHHFLKLVQGRLMQALGRSRKSFILNDMPVTSDAADMVSAGIEIEKEAMSDLYEKGKWWISQA